jgi:hypothetical protein
MMSTSSDSGMLFEYRAFGLHLGCNCRLPWLTATEDSGIPEIWINMGGLPPKPEKEQYQELWYSSSNKEASGESSLNIFRTSDGEDEAYWLRYADGTNIFVTDQASRLWATGPPEYSLEDVACYLLGPVMAIVAQLRNKTCLHASAVAIDGHIVAILGVSGAGKSTTAAAFAQAGYPVVADDMVVLTELDGRFLAEPAHPNLRLWPSAVEKLFSDPDALPPLTPNWEKCGLDLNQRGYTFQEDPLPMAALYILGERSSSDAAPCLTPLRGNDALMKLVSNSWGHYLKPPMLAKQLRVLGRLSNSVPIRELVAHEDPTRLPDLCRLLVHDVRRMSPRATLPQSPAQNQIPTQP